MRLAGVVVSLAGVLTIMSQGSLSALAAFRLNAGDLLRHPVDGDVVDLHDLPALASAGARHDRVPVRASRASASSWCCRSSWARSRSAATMHWTLAGFAALVAVALFSSVLAYIFWNRGVEAVGAPVAGLFVHLMPVFGVVLAWLFLGERLLPYHLVGIALILTGIMITSRRRQRQRRRRPSRRACAKRAGRYPREAFSVQAASHGYRPTLRIRATPAPARTCRRSGRCRPRRGSRRTAPRS